MVSFTVEQDGSTLFEAIISAARDLSTLPHLLDRADPDGTVRAALWQSDEVASIRSVVGVVPPLEDLAGHIVAGYAGLFELTAAPLDPATLAPAAPVSVRQRRPGLDRRASTTTPLGVLEVHAAMTPAGAFEALQITGDLIADPMGIQQVEQALVGSPADGAIVRRVVDAVYQSPEHFLLGIGPVSQTLSDTILRAVA